MLSHLLLVAMSRLAWLLDSLLRLPELMPRPASRLCRCCEYHIYCILYLVSLKTIMLCSSGLDAWLSFHYSNQTFRIFIEIKFSVEQHQLCKNTRNFI